MPTAARILVSVCLIGCLANSATANRVVSLRRIGPVSAGSTTSDAYICSGLLLGERAVLTTADCARQINQVQLVAAALDDFDSPNYFVERTTVHPDYACTTGEDRGAYVDSDQSVEMIGANEIANCVNNIAVVQLGESVTVDGGAPLAPVLNEGSSAAALRINTYDWGSRALGKKLTWGSYRGVFFGEALRPIDREPVEGKSWQDRWPAQRCKAHRGAPILDASSNVVALLTQAERNCRVAIATRIAPYAEWITQHSGVTFGQFAPAREASERATAAMALSQTTPAESSNRFDRITFNFAKPLSTKITVGKLDDTALGATTNYSQGSRRATVVTGRRVDTDLLWVDEMGNIGLTYVRYGYQSGGKGEGLSDGPLTQQPAMGCNVGSSDRSAAAGSLALIALLALFVCRRRA